MPAPDAPAAARQTTRFLCLYALAVAGGAVAYMPFLTILLPLQVSWLAGNSALTVLAQIAFAGAIAASLGNIGFGWASDRSGVRRPWIAAGLILSCALLPLMRFADGPVTLIAMIVLWQVCLNMMLGPLAAWAGDCVPDAQKGVLGGLIALAPALGALAGALVTLQGLASAGQRLALVAAMVAVLVAPVLIWGRPIAMPQLMAPPVSPQGDSAEPAAAHHAVLRMWLARLLVQVAEASLFAFLLLWFRSIRPDFHENDAASIFTAVLGTAVVLALLVGRWSDRADRPILPLALSAGTAALGLVIMAIAPSLAGAIVGYIIFGLASSVFLALHSSQTLRVLPQPRQRGRDLGYFNLTNTFPSLIMPWLTLALVPSYGFGALFLVLAGLAALACALLFTMQRRS